MHISNRDIAWYTLALKVAADSDVPDRHGCVLVRSGTVLAVATNRTVATIFPIKQGHAEQRVLFRTDATVNSTLYSARDHTNPISMPCKNCYGLLRQYKVRWVVFHDGITLQKLRVK